MKQLGSRWAWLAAAFIGLLAQASTAHASCGNYVHTGNPIDMPAADAPKPQDQTPLLPCPCHGPGCSQQREPVAPAPTTVSIFDHERWSAPLKGELTIVSHSQFRDFDATHASSHLLPTPIFHPPR